MAASACNTFRPNLWRPSTCANCYRPKAKHVLQARSASPQPRPANAAMGKESPARARSQSYREAKSPAGRICEGEGRQVGVVKPYAVVDLPADAINDRRYSEPSTAKETTGEGWDRSFKGSVCNTDTNKPNNSKAGGEKGRRQTISGLVRRGSGVIIPKRKAPSPPPRVEKTKLKKLPSPHPVRRNSAIKRSNGGPSTQPHPRPQKPAWNPSQPTTDGVPAQQRYSSSHSPLPLRSSPINSPQSRGRSVTVSSGSPPSLSPQYRGRSMTVSSGGSTPSLSPQYRGRSVAVSGGGSTPSLSPQHRGRSMTVSGGGSTLSLSPQCSGRSTPVSGRSTPCVSPQHRGRSSSSSSGHTPHVSPQHRGRSNSSSSGHTACMSPRHRGRAMTISGGSTNGNDRRTAPQKPPRTLSTFISTTEQDALLNQLPTEEADGMYTQQPLALSTITTSGELGSSNHTQRQPPLSGTEPQYPHGNHATPTTSSIESDRTNSAADSAVPRHERSSSSGSSVLSPTYSVFISPGQLHSQIVQLLHGTLQHVCQAFVEQLVCKGELWGLQWGELQVESDRAVCYKGIPLSLEVVTEDLDEGAKAEVELSRELPPHLHTSLVRSLLLPPPQTLHNVPQGSKYILRDCIDGGLLSDLLGEKRKSLSPEAYIELVLLCLVQVLTALKHLHGNGVCHRDVGLDCLYATASGSEWLVRLGDFNYALRRRGPLTTSTFAYGYHELKWLGGADSRLPPEVMDTSKETQFLDYSRTDCFAVGCLIHELLGKGNPFELDPDLVYRQYTPEDLPPLPHSSPLSPYLEHLANLLLRREPSARIGPSTALLLTQSLLWLPTQWFSESTSEPLVRHHFSYEKAVMVTSMADGATHPPALSTILKAHFLLSCDVTELLKALPLL